MQIKDLQPRQGKVDIVVDVLEVGDIREFDKFGKQGRVASAKARDESGEITLSLWNEQIDQIKPGMKVKITNGYVNEFQGNMQLTTGKFGKLEVVGESAIAPEEKPSKEPEEPAENPSSEETEEELPEEPVTDEEEII